MTNPTDKPRDEGELLREAAERVMSEANAWPEYINPEDARLLAAHALRREHRCKYCGQPTSTDPSDQERPADYCGEHT